MEGFTKFVVDNPGCTLDLDGDNEILVDAALAFAAKYATRRVLPRSWFQWLFAQAKMLLGLHEQGNPSAVVTMVLVLPQPETGQLLASTLVVSPVDRDDDLLHEFIFWVKHQLPFCGGFVPERLVRLFPSTCFSSSIIQRRMFPGGHHTAGGVTLARITPDVRQELQAFFGQHSKTNFPSGDLSHLQAVVMRNEQTSQLMHAALLAPAAAAFDGPSICVYMVAYAHSTRKHMLKFFRGVSALNEGRNVLFVCDRELLACEVIDDETSLVQTLKPTSGAEQFVVV